MTILISDGMALNPMVKPMCLPHLALLEDGMWPARSSVFLAELRFVFGGPRLRQWKVVDADPNAKLWNPTRFVEVGS